SALNRSVPTVRSRGQLREGFSYVRRTPTLAIPLLMMGLIGCLAYEFQVVLPVLADRTFHGGAQTYGFMTGAMGIGAVVGGLYVAAKGTTGLRPLVGSTGVFGVVILGAAVAPNLPLELMAMALVGAASVSVLSRGNSTLQLEAAPHMRGRVMALWVVAFLGSTPIGGPIVGAVSEHFGGRAGLMLGAAACLVAAAMGALAVRRLGLGQTAAPPVVTGAALR
ncbi:MAG: MFS transporter, partial [Mycobacteriaceae bacterium]